MLPVVHCGTTQGKGSATGTQLKTSSTPAKERCTSIEEQNNSGAGLVCITRGDAKTQVREVKGNGLQ